MHVFVSKHVCTIYWLRVHLWVCVCVSVRVRSMAKHMQQCMCVMCTTSGLKINFFTL